MNDPRIDPVALCNIFAAQRASQGSPTAPAILSMDTMIPGSLSSASSAALQSYYPLPPGATGYYTYRVPITYFESNFTSFSNVSQYLQQSAGLFGTNLPGLAASCLKCYAIMRIDYTKSAGNAFFYIDEGFVFSPVFLTNPATPGIAGNGTPTPYFLWDTADPAMDGDQGMVDAVFVFLLPQF